jgi:hypothetical protein
MPDLVVWHADQPAPGAEDRSAAGEVGYGRKYLAAGLAARQQVTQPLAPARVRKPLAGK